MRRPIAPLTMAAFAALLLVGPVAHGDRVALRDGTTMDGAVAIDEAAKTLVVSSTRGGMQVKDKVPFAKALAVETPDQKLSWLGSESDLLEASNVLWIATERFRYLEWADRALKAGDGAKAGALLDAAETRGATGFAIKSRRQKVSSAKGGPTVAEVAKAIDAEVAALPKARAALLWSRSEPSWATLPDATQIERATSVLALDPTHAPAMAFFAALVPEEFRGKFTWREWADWKRVLGGGAKLVSPPPLGTPAKGMTIVEKELARAAAIWKKDVMGVVRDGLVVIARPPASPGLERVSVTSSAVFAFIEEFFRTDAPRHKEVDPVIVWAHKDKNDLWSHLTPVEERWADTHLRQQSGKKRERAAFFAPDEGLTKVLSPDVPGTKEAEALLLQDIAYFTMIHWFYVGCPRFRWSETESSMTAPGFWITTDFVAALCNGAVNPATGRWGAPRKDLSTYKNWQRLKEVQATVPWAGVLDGTGDAYLEAVKSAAGSEPAAMHIFAWSVQAELAALYLVYGTEPALRRKVADHVTEFFLGKAKDLTTKSVYGMEPVELGRRIEAWASK